MTRARKVVAFQGSRQGRSAFSLVNAQWSAGLERSGDYAVEDFDSGLQESGNPEGERKGPDFVIHHDFETHFSAFRAPKGPRCVAVRTWDFGPLPTAWAEKINAEFQQFWAYSHWIAGQAEAAGVHPGRVEVVPLGIDPRLFRPDGEPFQLPTEKSFTFLFVGGVSPRKGTDILLKAYAQAFTKRDDVALVVKDHSGDLFYQKNEIRNQIIEMAEDPGSPEVVHLDRFLPGFELAALYRTCDVAVFPYRAEGFCLPILEAMASGTPPLVPDFGACLDFCTADTSYLVPVRRIHLPVSNRFKVALGFEEEVAEVDFCEMNPSTLAEYMRYVFEASATERDRLATAGVSSAQGSFSWDDSLTKVLDCLRTMERA